MKTSYSYYDIQGLCFLSNEKEKKPQTDLCENENEQIEFQAPKQQYFQKILKYHYQRKKTPKSKTHLKQPKSNTSPLPPPKKVCLGWWMNLPSLNHQTGIYCQCESCLSGLKTKTNQPKKNPQPYV